MNTSTFITTVVLIFAAVAVASGVVSAHNNNKNHHHHHQGLTSYECIHDSPKLQKIFAHHGMDKVQPVRYQKGHHEAFREMVRRNGLVLETVETTTAGTGTSDDGGKSHAGKKKPMQLQQQQQQQLKLRKPQHHHSIPHDDHNNYNDISTDENHREQQHSRAFKPQQTVDCSGPVTNQSNPACIPAMRIHVEYGDLYDTNNFCAAVNDVRSDFKSTMMTCGSDDILTTEKRNWLEQNIIPAAVQRLMSVFKVVPAASPIKTTAPCGSFTIPASHQTPGQSNTDFVLFVAAAPTDANTGAWAGLCEQDQYGRPISGVVNMNPKYINWTTDERTKEQAVKSIMHELMHTLGLSKTTLQAKPEYTTNITARGKMTTFMTTPNVVNATRAHFNCPTSPGADIEDEEESFSHWDMRTLKDELMAVIVDPLNKLSAVTLGAMQDLGHYWANFSNAEDLLFGANAGCGFQTEKCGTEAGGMGTWFCSTSNTAGCASNRRGFGFCDMRTYGSDLPAHYQYFADPKKGGAKYQDYCPTFVEYSDGRCDIDRASTVAEASWGHTYTAQSRCFSTYEGGLQPPNTPWYNNIPRCLSTRCVDFNGTMIVVFKVTTSSWQSCTLDGSATNVSAPTGWQGTIECPEASAICEPQIEDTAPPEILALALATPGVPPTAEPPNATSTPTPTTLSPGTTAAPPTPAPPTPQPTATPCPLAGKSIYMPDDYASCCKYQLQNDTHTKACTATLARCSAAFDMWNAKLERPGNITPVVASRCDNVASFCAKEYVKCIDQAALIVGDPIPCPWKADMLKISATNRSAQCVSLMTDIQQLTSCSVFLPKLDFAQSQCYDRPTHTPVPGLPPVPTPVPPVVVKETTKAVLSGISAMTFMPLYCSKCVVENPTSGDCLCTEGTVAQRIKLYHSDKGARNTGCNAESPFNLTFCTVISELPAELSAQLSASGPTTAAAAAAQKGGRKLQHEQLIVERRSMAALEEPQQQGRIARRLPPRRGAWWWHALSANASAGNASEVDVASMYVKRQLNDGTWACVTPNFFAKNCSCPSHNHVNRTFLMPIPHPSGAGFPVPALVSFCASLKTTMFIVNYELNTCYSPQPNTTCTCLPGSPKMTVPVTYTNMTSNQLSYGELVMCAAPPVVHSNPVLSAGTTGAAVVTGIAGGPGASMIQGAAVLTSMECSSGDAKEMGGDGALVPYVIGDWSYSPLLSLWALFFAVWFLQFMLFAMHRCCCVANIKEPPEEEEGEEGKDGARKKKDAAKYKLDDDDLGSPTAAYESPKDNKKKKKLKPGEEEEVLPRPYTAQEKTTMSMAKTKYPTYTYRTLLFAYPGMCFYSASLCAAHNATLIDRAIGGGTGIFLLAFVVFAHYWGTLAGRKQDLLELVFAPYRAVHKNGPCLLTFWVPRGWWKGDSHLIARYGEFYEAFDDKHINWVTAIHLYKAAIFGVLGAYPAGDDKDLCRKIYVAMAALLGLLGLLVMLLRPHRLPFDNLATVLLSFASAAIALSQAYEANQEYTEMLFLYIIMFSLGGLVVWLSFPFIEDCMQNYEEKHADEFEDEDEVEGKGIGAGEGGGGGEAAAAVVPVPAAVVPVPARKRSVRREERREEEEEEREVVDDEPVEAVEEEEEDERPPAPRKAFTTPQRTPPESAEASPVDGKKEKKFHRSAQSKVKEEEVSDW